MHLCLAVSTIYLLTGYTSAVSVPSYASGAGFAEGPPEFLQMAQIDAAADSEAYDDEEDWMEQRGIDDYDGIDDFRKADTRDPWFENNDELAFIK